VVNYKNDSSLVLLIQEMGLRRIQRVCLFIAITIVITIATIGLISQDCCFIVDQLNTTTIVFNNHVYMIQLFNINNQDVATYLCETNISYDDCQMFMLNKTYWCYRQSPFYALSLHPHPMGIFMVGVELFTLIGLISLAIYERCKIV